jgi:hypothetical protein
VPPAKRKRAVRKKSEIESDEEDDDDDEEEEAPDTSADVLLAQSLSGKRASTRNLDKKGKHLKKQAALARIREVCYIYFLFLGYILSSRHDVQYFLMIFFIIHAEPGK